ncbi:hypothetical protein EFP_198 [Enterococcus phage EF24C]|uniref:Uncharacterized protein n=1 Tax=Enterococcus phage phiEF24C TaxID=442493 RepID=A8E2Q0_BPPHE|nr:hypothetical protein EFP_gp198 [Enterococcus phage EF24C]BAF81466.1 hypothetical protein EFP_198 [Enterococcus phage EF24C]
MELMIEGVSRGEFSKQFIKVSQTTEDTVDITVVNRTVEVFRPDCVNEQTVILTKENLDLLITALGYANERMT